MATKRAKRRPHRGGTPPRAGAPSTVLVPVRCTPEERERWQAAADAAGTTLSAVARQAWDALPSR